MTTDDVKKLFTYEHLPKDLKATSKPFHDIAVELSELGGSAELTLAIRKLWEAKNLVVYHVASNRPSI